MSYSVKLVQESKPKGQTVFTSSGNFIVPNKVQSIDIFVVGSGSPSACSTIEGYMSYANHGGAGGLTKTQKNKTVNPGDTISVSIGGGTFGNSTIAGGLDSGYVWHTNNGGSGGGGGISDSTNTVSGGRGGSDGGSGVSVSKDYRVNGGGGCWQGGTGQGSTTRAFGESKGTLYAGGGGGGACNTCPRRSDNGDAISKYGFNAIGGSGGVGGGGNGGAAVGGATTSNTGYPYISYQGTQGGYGTGGGAGGAAILYVQGNYMDSVSVSGGTGCAIIRWGY